MRKLLTCLLLLTTIHSFSQILEPVKWKTSTKEVAENEYILITTATIDEGWHLYSQHVPDGGPIPTTFNYSNAEKLGETKEPKGYTVNDPIFEMEITYFGDKAQFEQKVKVESGTRIVNATVDFMVCDDSRCLPPTTVNLTYQIPEKKAATKIEKPSKLKIDLSDEPTIGILEPIKWNTSVERISETEYDLIINAAIEKDWHLYSQYTAEGGSLPILIEKDTETTDYELVGKAIESDTIKKYNDVFEVYETYFDNSTTLKQRIILNNKEVTQVALRLTGQVCKSVCLQVDERFVFSLEGEDISETTNVVNEQNPTTNNTLYGMEPGDVTLIENDLKTSKSLWTIFGLGFLGGLLALLTPCVFPMIPLTVSFFTKTGGTSKGSGIGKAVLYGVFILLVYLLLSVPFHLLDSVNEDILNEISTNIWLNIIFFAVFVFFAFSFFGYYELTLPESWTSKTTKGENVGGIVGVFFMALTLAIVSFSCTGPILGSLLAGSLSSDGGAWQLTAGMAGFGVSLGLPFALFAMFPNMMNALPKSGGWLNTTKVVLGFLELALAFKFLSNADLVAHWGILKIEAFLGIWILCFGGLALYLFGKVKFPHDSPIKKLSFFRISTGVLIAAFTIYLISGFRVNKETNTFTSLTLLSGLAPPVGYSWLLPSTTTNNLKTFKDLKAGIAYAKEVNKPIMLDFTGYACVNCRKMEEHVWPKQEIDYHLKNDYVVVSLYVDDKKELPKAEQLEVNRVNGGTRLLKNYGHKWANFQTQFFRSNSQPYYVLLTPDGTQMLGKPVGYTPDDKEYAQFLKSGLAAFKTISQK